MRSSRQVDYDHLASTYDRRFAEGGVRATALALLALAHDLKARRVLEVGCGTAHWLAELRTETDRLYGLDLSAGMLSRARDRDVGLRLVRGRAGRLATCLPAKSPSVATRQPAIASRSGCSERGDTEGSRVAPLPRLHLRPSRCRSAS